MRLLNALAGLHLASYFVTSHVVHDQEAHIPKTGEYMFIAYSFPLSSLTKPSHIRERVGRWTHDEEGKGRRWGGP